MAREQPSVYFAWPTTFQPLPDSLPPTVPPPLDENTFRAPFGINANLYNFALRPEIPLAFASVYVVAVFALNAYNRDRNHQPWSISKTAAFGYFVVVHNVLLALYSFATFGAMTRAILRTWPGFANANGAAGLADALCKLHGPRGLGDAATFNTTIDIWEVKNTAIHLLPSGNPDPTDVGRLWNEGLAFWGWTFYVSKFYEVIDTLIILAKGKRSATLQTYHHAGAMLCVWAGIRYMSPPIWMFVFINSAIHALMYTYFTASALGIKVPQTLKRTLTSLQIAQFVFGASYAAVHLFVAYDIPIQTPYQVVSSVERAVSTASSAAAAITSSVSEFVETPTVTASVASLVKKLLLRAAGEEGVAERVGLSKPNAVDYVPSAPYIEQKLEKIWERRFETHYRSEWSRVNCIDTTGQAFAIYINLLYLTPLTWLFGRFFIRAYTARGKAARPKSASAAAQVAADVAKEASKNTEESFERGGIKAEDEIARRSSQGKEKGEELYEQLRKDVKSMKDGTWRDRRVSERVQSYEGKVKTAAEKAVEGVRNLASGSRGSSKRVSEQKDESAVVDDAPAASDKGAEKREESPEKQAAEGAVEKEEEPEAPATGPDEKKDSAAADASSNPAPGSQPTEKQEENLSESGAVRSDTEPEQKENAKEEESIAGDESQSVETGATKESVDTSSTPSQEERNEDDTDAMGRSGVGIEPSDAASSPSSPQQPQTGNEEFSPETKAAET